MPSLLRGLLAITFVGMAMIATVPASAVESDKGQLAPLYLKMPTASLRKLCRDGSAETSALPAVDANAILKHHEEARAACDRLIDTSHLEGRDLAEALLDRADLNAAGQGDTYARALADYARAMTLVPDLASAYWRRGKAYLLYARDLPAALSDLDEAVRLDSSQPEFFVTRASILSWSGQPDPALADLNQALSLDPHNVHALTNRGLAYFNKGDTSRALADFDAALSLAPDDSGLYGFRSAARRSAGDEAGAKIDDTKMMELMFRKAP
jgi:tetratricopeptide (TPR) repeat protein